VTITLTFSRRVDYRLLESESRLRLMVREPVDEASRIDRRLPSEIVRRIRFDRTRRSTDIVFFLGRAFETFSVSELDEPHRIVLMFHGAVSATLPPEEGMPGLDSGAAGVPSAEPHPGLPGSPFGGDERERSPGEIRMVVIDPGHGGEEEGAVGSTGLKEKDLVLDLAQRLRDRLRSAGFTVALTREGDQSVDLTTRTALANNLRADLFISLHANSSARTRVRGAETYFLSWDTDDEEASSVAARENLPRDAGTARGEDDAIALVLWEMAQAEHLGRSSRLAERIQAELNSLAGIPSRGVKQAPFRVLVGADMPAVLVEVGFLSNATEESLLTTPDYRDRVASSLAAAVERFRSESLREARAVAGGGAGGGGRP
jgi:N-acetylmuramoyl-L-alanine amidase